MASRKTELAAAAAPEPEYDLAISFLAKDDKIAAAIEAKLAGLKVFFFPRKQEELIGTNGLESMRKPFLGARVVVVLYRAPYGDTPWTGVEKIAIEERCLREQFRPLVFVHLDKKDAVPAWVPSTHIRCDWEAYGLDELVGAIKLRVQELGGVIGKPDALSHAKHVRREGEFLEERKRMLGGAQWVDQVGKPAAWGVVRRACELIAEGAAGMRPEVFAACQGRTAVISDESVSLTIEWHQGIFGNVMEDAYLTVREFRGYFPIPGRNRMFVFSPERIKEHRYLMDVTRAHEVAWKQSGKSELMTSEEMAHAIAIIFFDLIGKVNSGKVAMPFA